MSFLSGTYLISLRNVWVSCRLMDWTKICVEISCAFVSLHNCLVYALPIHMLCYVLCVLSNIACYLLCVAFWCVLLVLSHDVYCAMISVHVVHYYQCRHFLFRISNITFKRVTLPTRFIFIFIFIFI